MAFTQTFKTYFLIVFLTSLLLFLPNNSLADLNDLSLEELMQVKISAVSGKQEEVKNAAAAVHVITSQEISHSNAQSIPELLRSVPGLHVGRIDGSNWAISSRGFNGLFNNKMLVMIDGRSIYTPIFGGVFWQIQDTMLEDIEKIEVIRGPGSSVWGANAVNGVINIITKKSSESKGTLLSTSLSNEGQTVAARQGVELGKNENIRMYAKGRNNLDFSLEDSRDGYNGYNTGQAGFRYDQEVNDDQFTLQGDWYAGNINFDFYDPISVPGTTSELRSKADVAGGNVLSRWTTRTDNGGQFEAQSYFDRTQRYDKVLTQKISTVDGTLQYSFPKIGIHQFMMGSGYRFNDLELEPHSIIAELDPDNSINTASGFIQDQIALLDTLSLTTGLKFEHHEFSGSQWQPTIRLTWETTPHTSLWLATSKAARVPNIGENSLVLGQPLVLPDGTPFQGKLVPNKSQKSEILNGFEFGARTSATKYISVDFASFYNVYDDIASFETITGPTFDQRISNYPFIPINQFNNGEIDAYGFELSSTAQVKDDMQLTAWYSYLDISSSFNGVGDGDGSVSRTENLTPTNQAQLKLVWNINNSWDLATSLRYVDAISGGNIPSYIAGGAKLKYKILKETEISLGIENLFANDHIEYQSDYITIPRTDIPTFGYFQVRSSF